jgi:hypothetical protein
MYHMHIVELHVPRKVFIKFGVDIMNYEYNCMSWRRGIVVWSPPEDLWVVRSNPAIHTYRVFKK